MEGKRLSRRALLKTAAAFGGLAALSSLAAACGATPTPQVKEGQVPAAGRTISIDWWGYAMWKGIGDKGDDPAGQPTDYMQYMKEEFEKKYPNVLVNIEYPIKTAGTDYWAKIDSAVFARRNPNMVMGAVMEAARYVGLGIVSPVDEYVPKELASDFVERAWKEGNWYGKHYFYPWRLSFGGGLAINKWLVDKYGHSDLLPKDPARDWTTEQFEELLAAMTIDTNKDGKTDVYGGVFAASGGYEIFQFLFGFGAKFWNEDETKVILNSPEGVEGLTWLVGLEWDKKYLMPGTAGRPGAERTQMMQENRASLMHAQGAGGPYAAFVGLKEYKHFYAPPPHKPGKKSGVQTNMQGYYVMRDRKGDKDADEMSHKFLQWLVSDRAMELLVSVGRWPPARKSYLPQMAEKDPHIKAGMTMLDMIVSFGRRAPCATINYEMGPKVVAAAFSREKTPQKALDDYAAEATKLIAESIAQEAEDKKRIEEAAKK